MITENGLVCEQPAIGPADTRYARGRPCVQRAAARDRRWRRVHSVWTSRTAAQISRAFTCESTGLQNRTWECLRVGAGWRVECVAALPLESGERESGAASFLKMIGASVSTLCHTALKPASNTGTQHITLAERPAGSRGIGCSPSLAPRPFSPCSACATTSRSSGDPYVVMAQSPYRNPPDRFAFFTHGGEVQFIVSIWWSAAQLH